MHIDSNLLIYAVQPKYKNLREWVIDQEPSYSIISRVEVLGFSKLQADYTWQYKPQGSVIIVRNGRTSGNAAGFTFAGTFDRGAHYTDIEGTVVPLSDVNRIISKIPLVGDILTGGSGSVFAATYKIKGDPENPKTSVNPLSVLAPGILRQILFQ